MRQKTTSQSKTASLAFVDRPLSRRSWFGLACLVLALLIIWFWYAQQSVLGMFGYVPSSSRRAVDSTTETFTNTAAKSTPGTTSSGSTTASASYGAAGGQSSTNTTTTNNTTVERTSTTGSPAPSPTPSSPKQTVKQTQPAKDNMPLLYASIDGGQDKQQLISLAGSNPDKCTQLNLDSLGQQEVCSWSNDNKAVTATLLNNQVTAKTKVGF